MTCKWLITMVIVSLLSRGVGPLPNGLFMAYKWGLLTTYKSLDDPSSRRILSNSILPMASNLNNPRSERGPRPFD